MTNHKTISISIPEEMLRRVDAVSTEELRNRSEVIREALRDYLARRKADKRRTS